MKTIKISLAVLFAVTYGTIVHAQSNYEDEDYISYDNIVEELNQTRSVRPRSSAHSDPFATIKIHTGVGIVGTMMTLSPEGTKDLDFQTTMQGFQFNLGIDLFSTRWAAEGSIRSFGEVVSKDDHSFIKDKQTTKSSEQARVSLKEFDLKIVYRPLIAKRLRLRTGGGLAARYLNMKYSYKGTHIKKEFTTPSSIIFVGADAQLTNNLSLGAEISLRSALIEDTIEDSALDGTLLVGAHF